MYDKCVDFDNNLLEKWMPELEKISWTTTQCPCVHVPIGVELENNVYCQPSTTTSPHEITTSLIATTSTTATASTTFISTTSSKAITSTAVATTSTTSSKIVSTSTDGSSTSK